jgi:hypothetical protein
MVVLLGNYTELKQTRRNTDTPSVLSEERNWSKSDVREGFENDVV